MLHKCTFRCIERAYAQYSTLRNRIAESIQQETVERRKQNARQEELKMVGERRGTCWSNNARQEELAVPEPQRRHNSML
ncbi:hypothetical protein BIFGAL_03537 [Bifidobacterium gallicum DSM 20093 = LMG 11596]|uniref:Uncharacterized protein n=1 Tax=Bifidobacterium gallicum DSM 20093 = LMG 11596 TaxID=561180 RepID=D1NUL2_9BIFI|nr:hypothetical protein BIFGAL_03537 [Bifidobacterium gallicum DSM 20093 = LMG 11596]